MLKLNPNRTQATFFEEDHRYIDGNGIVYTSVTQAMAPLSAMTYRAIPQRILDNAAEIGTAVHCCTEYLDQDELDEESVIFEWVPYIDAWKRFKRDFKPDLIFIELRLIHPGLQYAGAVDRVALINGELWILDIKTTNELYSHVGIQLAAYSELLNANLLEPQKFRRAAVQLKEDGTYQFKEYTGKDDFKAFLALLTISNWIKKHE